MVEYRHFKRADGFLFHKNTAKPALTDAVIKAYLKDGCIEVDANGEPLKKAPKKDDKE